MLSDQTERFSFPPQHRIERFRNELIISPSGQEGMADRQEPLDGQRHGAVDAAQEAHLGDRDGVRQGRDLDRLSCPVKFCSKSLLFTLSHIFTSLG